MLSAATAATGFDANFRHWGTHLTARIEEWPGGRIDAAISHSVLTRSLIQEERSQLGKICVAAAMNQ